MSDNPKPKPKGPIRRAADSVYFWVGVFAAIMVLWQVTPAIGLQLPRWTWWGEFQARARQVDQRFEKFQEVQSSARRELYRTRRDVLRGQLFQVDKEIRALKRGNQPIPESLHRERQRLNDQIEGVKRSLRGS